MPYIRTVAPKDATGELRDEYEAAVKRAGRVYHIVSLQSLNPRVLHASIELYKAIMHGPSALSRADREMIATVVSKANDPGSRRVAGEGLALPPVELVHEDQRERRRRSGATCAAADTADAAVATLDCSR